MTKRSWTRSEDPNVPTCEVQGSYFSPTKVQRIHRSQPTHPVPSLRPRVVPWGSSWSFEQSVVLDSSRSTAVPESPSIEEARDAHTCFK